MSNQNLEIVQQIYQAFSRGDIPAVLEHIAPELRLFGVISEAKDIPWHVQITSKKDVPLFFKALAEAIEITRFEPHAFVASADHVYCSLAVDSTVRKNGRRMMNQLHLHRFTFKGGRVVEWRGTEDTAAVRAALGA